MKKKVSQPKKTTINNSPDGDSVNIHDAMVINKLPGYFLILCIVLSFLALLYILSPFLTVILVAAVLTVSFYPIYKWLLSRMQRWPRFASLLSCLFVILVIVVPLTVFIFVLTNQALDTYDLVSQKINSGEFDRYLKWAPGGFFYDLVSQVKPIAEMGNVNLKEAILGRAQDLSSYLFSQAQTIFTGVFSVLFSFLIMLFSMFYFFKDGTKLVDKVGVISPFPRNYEKDLFKRIYSMVRAIVFGVFLTAIAQGVVGGIGFAIAGISNAIFWGATIAFASLIPAVGTALIWVPAAVILAIMGDYGFAIFLAIWGVFAIGSVDNILRPYLIGGKAHTYPLLTFFVILGGIFVMGFKGIIIGPLVLMFMMSFLQIYEIEYSKFLNK